MPVAKCGLQKAFENLDSVGIRSEHCYTCCLECGQEAMKERDDEREGDEDYHGYIFYSMEDMYDATHNGHLELGFGELVEEEFFVVAGQICNIFGLYGLTTTWNGAEPIIMIHLNRKDRDFIQRLADEKTAMCQESNADEFRQSQILRKWRIQAFRQRTARRRIKKPLMNWALRPEGPIYRCIALRFNLLRSKSMT